MSDNVNSKDEENVFAQNVKEEELKQVNGGVERDYEKDGCASTVKSGDACVFSDNCLVLIYEYKHPLWHQPCPICHEYTLYQKSMHNYNALIDELRCRNCGFETTKGDFFDNYKIIPK